MAILKLDDLTKEQMLYRIGQLEGIIELVAIKHPEAFLTCAIMLAKPLSNIDYGDTNSWTYEDPQTKPFREALNMEVAKLKLKEKEKKEALAKLSEYEKELLNIPKEYR